MSAPALQPTRKIADALDPGDEILDRGERAIVRRVTNGTHNGAQVTKIYIRDALRPIIMDPWRVLRVIESTEDES